MFPLIFKSNMLKFNDSSAAKRIQNMLTPPSETVPGALHVVICIGIWYQVWHQVWHSLLLRGARPVEFLQVVVPTIYRK